MGAGHNVSNLPRGAPHFRSTLNEGQPEQDLLGSPEVGAERRPQGMHFQHTRSGFYFQVNYVASRGYSRVATVRFSPVHLSWTGTSFH